jgi:glycosyltransferase involved in cell wall biosynthesis
MIDGARIVVVMPAYNSAATLGRTLAEVDRKVVDEVILVDDASVDGTAELSRRLGLPTLVHERNGGYGANQKTCYAAALAAGADVVVMLHPDYQYPPRLIRALAEPIARGRLDVVLGSRILDRQALRGGMPLYKYAANRVLTAVENAATGAALSEYHTGYRAFSREVLERLPLDENSDDFVFDAQMLAQCLYFGFRVGEVASPARYEPESSSIGFARAVVYGLGVLAVTARFVAAKRGLAGSRIFSASGARLAAVAKARRARG